MEGNSLLKSNKIIKAHPLSILFDDIEANLSN